MASTTATKVFDNMQTLNTIATLGNKQMATLLSDTKGNLF